VLDEGLLIVNDAIKGINAPVAFVGIAEKGYVSLKLDTICDGGHSSMPGRENAIYLLCKALCRLHKKAFRPRLSKPCYYMLKSVGPAMSRLKRLVFANLWLFKPLVLRILANAASTNALIRTTATPTIFTAGVKENVIPESASCVINCRILPDENVEQTLNRVRKIVNDKRINVAIMEKFVANPSKISAIDTDGFRDIAASIGDLFGGVIIAPSLLMMGTDSRHYARISRNIYRFLPIVLDDADRKRIHGQNERLSVENYRKMIGFYINLLARE
jgi:carboxypeptidase PM20D1